MKELSIEEKAKRYDEAIKRLEDIKTGKCQKTFMFTEGLFDYIFPELKESERIRKALIRFHKSTIDVDGIKGADILAWLEKQGKNMGISEATKQKLEDNLNKALEKETPESCNEFLEKQGGQKPAEFDDTNAKRMFIKALECVEEQNAKGYKLTDCDKNSWWEDFKAYTYCTIEQKSVIKMKTPEESLGIDSDTYNKIVDGCVYGEQNPAWSEEDNAILEKCVGAVKSSCYSYSFKLEVENWLKSLKERYTWRPSDEQIVALRWVLNNVPYNKHKEEISGLLDQIKGL